MSDKNEEETKEELGPKEFLSKIREKVGDALKTSPDPTSTVLVYNIEQYIQMIRALLKTNQEIWDRCKELSACVISEGKTTEFRRLGYMSIATRPYDGKTYFITEAIKQRLTFDTSPLSQLPFELKNIFEPKPVPDHGSLIDFQSLFEKSLVLHDDVLGPFLATLKTHLESVQVCMGEIEGWLMLPNETKVFIESTFGKTLNSCNAQECKNPLLHPNNFTCTECGYHKDDHFKKNHDLTCRRGNCRMDSYFHCWGCELLLESSVPGTIKLDFDISNQKERGRLKKCFELVSQYN